MPTATATATRSRQGRSTNRNQQQSSRQRNRPSTTNIVEHSLGQGLRITLERADGYVNSVICPTVQEAHAALVGMNTSVDSLFTSQMGGANTGGGTGASNQSTTRKRQPMSEEARAKLAAAGRARWAKQRRAQARTAGAAA
jgi:hypothetical protein